MITIFASTITPRLKYACHLIFKKILGVEFRLLNNASEFNAIEGAKLSYGRHPIGNELFFRGGNLLWEKDIRQQELKVEKWQGYKAFFFHNDIRAEWPFDPFALSFFLASRYEEYLPAKRDIHGRFTAESSLAYKADFLDVPLVNVWALELRTLLKRKFPFLHFKERRYQFIPTYDIDHAWAFKYKGWLRSLANYAKDVVEMDFAKLKLRLAVQLQRKSDPFYTFDYLDACFSSSACQPLFFFLVGRYGPHDKNISIKEPAFQQLIQAISKKHHLGIHPSYISHNRLKRLKNELDNLSKVTVQTITSSRNHYLRLNFPTTYRNLLALGISNDYTMGYAAQSGFRASLAVPFPWYDLLDESMTSLMLHPFQVMDVTLRHYLKLTPEEAVERVKTLRETVKRVEGDFVTLWHNDSLSEYEDWVGWRKVHDSLFLEV